MNTQPPPIFYAATSPESGALLSSSVGRILCVGSDLSLQEIRCVVLQRHGYEAKSATFADALEQIEAQDFDLVILPKALYVYNEVVVLVGARKAVRILQVAHFTGPDDLVKSVKEALPSFPREDESRG